MIQDCTRDEVGAQLFEAENQIDAMIGRLADLMGGVSRLRASGEASMLATQRPLARMAAIQSLLAEIRLKMTGVHGDLAKLLPDMKDMTTGCPCMGSLVKDISGPPELA